MLLSQFVDLEYLLLQAIRKVWAQARARVRTSCTVATTQ